MGKSLKDKKNYHHMCDTLEHTEHNLLDSEVGTLVRVLKKEPA